MRNILSHSLSLGEAPELRKLTFPVSLLCQAGQLITVTL